MNIIMRTVLARNVHDGEIRTVAIEKEKKYSENIIQLFNRL